MKPSMIVLGFVALGVTCACSSHTTGPSASSTSTSASTSAPRSLAVGQEVDGDMSAHGAADTYDLAIPSDGTLVVRIHWPATQGRLEVDFDGRIVSQDESPIVARVAVTSGRYHLVVADAAPWDYDVFRLQYVMTTAME